MFPTPQPRQRPTPPPGHRGVGRRAGRVRSPARRADWEVTAASWLLDLCPPDYRRFSGLRRHVVVLARFAVLHVEAQQLATRRGLSEIRGDLKDVADEAVVTAAVQTFQLEDARLLGVRREVGLVEDALRGRRYRVRM